MGNNVELVKTTVNVSGAADLGNVVDSVTIIEGVNQIPACYLSLHKKELDKQAQKALDPEQLSALAGYQEGRLGGQESPEVTVVVTKDSQKEGSHDISFRGSVISPDIALAAGVFNNAVSLLHGISNMNSLQPYIYGAVPLPHGSTSVVGNRADYIPQFAENTTAESPVFVQRLYHILKDRMAEFDKNGSNWVCDETAGFVREIHEVNHKNLFFLQQIAEASFEETYEGMSSLLSRASNRGQGLLNLAINATVADYLTLGGEDFMSILLAMCDSTQSFYQPPSVIDQRAPYGRIRPFRTMLDGAPVFKDVSVVYLGVSEQSSNSDPVTTALITGVPYRETGSTTTVARVNGFFIPYETYQTFFKVDTRTGPNGRGITIPLPEWLPQSIMEREMSEPGSVFGTGRNLSGYKSHKSETTEALRGFYSGSYYNILEEYGKNVLASIQLAPFVAQIKTKLDFNWQAGERYRIRAVRGEKETPVEFEGFLYKATHDVKVASGGSSSFTTLDFNYVKFL